MDKARVVVFEDDEYNRTSLQTSLTSRGHTVVAEGTNLPDSLEIVNQLGSGALQADIIVLDGNLNKTRFATGSDARAIRSELDAISEQTPGLKVIGNSVLPMDEYGVRVDADAQKSKADLLNIIDGF